MSVRVSWPTYSQFIQPLAPWCAKMVSEKQSLTSRDDCELSICILILLQCAIHMYKSWNGTVTLSLLVVGASNCIAIIGVMFPSYKVDRTFYESNGFLYFFPGALCRVEVRLLE